MTLDGKVALVTGAGKGIGKGIALAFARQGAEVVVNAAHQATADAVAGIIKSELKGNALAIEADVSKAEEVDAMVEKALKELGKIDILVNNAGIVQEFAPTIEQSIEKWDRVISVHLRGTYMCCRRVGQWMVKNNGGAILNMSSVAAFGSFPMRTSYGPAKAGIINLTQVLAVEWAKYHIRVNSIAPGYVRTERFENSVKEGRANPEAILKRIPLGRMGTPEDVARAAVFLVSDEASYITGATLPVDGGWLADIYV